MSQPEEPLGFSRLVCVEPTGLRLSHTSILLPSEMADEINMARRELIHNPYSKDVWESACVFPARHEVFAAKEAEAFESNRATSSANSALRPEVPLAAKYPERNSAFKRRVLGRSVTVIDVTQIQRRRADLGLRTKLTRREEDTENKLMDELERRGEKRVVGLKPDWRRRLATLRANMPHLAEVVSRIEECCALSTLTRQPVRIPPLLLIGSPGVGKTHFARQVAAMLGVPEFVYHLESAETTSVLTGSEKHWGNSEIGQLFKLIVQDGAHANPVIVLDEIDKANTGGNYRPANALHAVLEPITSRQIRDKSIDMVFDASYVVYIATANDLTKVDATLLSRFEVFHISEPDPDAAFALAKSIVTQVLRDMKLTRHFSRPDDEVVSTLASFGRPRRMYQLLTRALGRAVVDGRKQLKASDFEERLGRTSPCATPVRMPPLLQQSRGCGSAGEQRPL